MTPRPPDLPPDQHQIWDTLTAKAPNADPALLRQAVAAQREWDQLNQVCQGSGPVINGPRGVQPNPAYVQRRAAAQLLLTYHRQLGLHKETPRSATLQGNRLPCDKCGALHDPRRCDGHARSRNGVQCGLSRGERTDHQGFGNCVLHGGMSPSGLKAADAERGRKSFFKLAKHGLPPITDPLSELGNVAAEQRAAAVAWAELVNELGSSLEMDALGTQRVHAAAEQFRRSQNDARAALAEMAHLNIDERLVAIQAQASELLVERMTAVLEGFEQRMRQLLEARLAPGESWPSDAELEELMDGSLADATGS